VHFAGLGHNALHIAVRCRALPTLFPVVCCSAQHLFTVRTCLSCPFACRSPADVQCMLPAVPVIDCCISASWRPDRTASGLFASLGDYLTFALSSATVETFRLTCGRRSLGWARGWQ
jgi:hypothetical protein